MSLLTEQWLLWGLLLHKNSNFTRNWELCTYCSCSQMTLLTKQWLFWGLLLCKNSNFTRNWELYAYCKLFTNDSSHRTITVWGLLSHKNSNFTENWLFWGLLLCNNSNFTRNWELCTYCDCTQMTLFAEQELSWVLLLHKKLRTLQYSQMNCNHMIKAAMRNKTTQEISDLVHFVFTDIFSASGFRS